jgi:putative membrane-bound dehydrogenase-like protein
MKHILLNTTLALALAATGLAADAKKSILMIAGKPSHGPAQHEHNAGIQLLAKCIKENVANADVSFHLNAEWPSAEELAKADTIVIYSDGGGGHPALQGDHLAQLGKEMKRGAGFVCLHYAVEVPITPGGPEFTDWLGGYFEPNWSVNPHWDADYKELPKHPISNGVKPFATNDEWYFHMRFRKDMQGVTPILTAVAPDSTMSRKDGPHEGNPTVREEVKNKVPQHTSWAVQREDGGRGFGFSGGHYHNGWANNDQRKLVLNAILWTAKIEVPASGVDSKVTEEDLKANLDPKPGQGLPEKKVEPKPAAQPEKKAASAGTFTKPVATSGLVHQGTEIVKADLKGAKELYLIATDGGDGFTADWANWLEPVLIKADGSKLKLTEMAPKEATVGFGKLGINKNAAGQEMKMNGTAVPFGFGAHAPSAIGFTLPADVVGFESKVGIDDGGTKQGGGATVVFKVFTINPGESALATAKQSPTKAYGFGAAQELMSGFKTPEGLEAKLLASEPMIQNPTNIDVDAKGRVWVAECVNYRKYASPALRPEGDRITINEDTTGKGVFDKQTLFYQGKEITNALGIGVFGNKVIVSAAPNMWLFEDTDGDGKADKKTLLFTGIKGEQHDHSLHAVSFGLDGKFYFNMGNAGEQLLDAEGQPVVDMQGNEVKSNGKPYRQGMILRFDLVGDKVKNVETLAHDFRNNYEVAVDSFGGMWQSDNDDDGNKGVRINNIVDYGNYGYSDEMTGASWQSPRTNIETEIPLRHWHQNDPGTIPNLLQTGGGSPTGICVNEAQALGKQFENQVIHCDAGPRTVRAYPVKKSGAGYTAEMVDILTSDDTWYRPSDCGIAPDGSLIVADWYDPGVGGHAMGDNDPETIRGRLYRVAQKGNVYKVTAPDLSTAASTVEALKSPNKATQYLAWQKLVELGAKAEAPLRKLSKSDNARLRARAMHLLIRIPGKFESEIANALEDKDADIRCAAVRELRLATANGNLPESIKDAAAYVLPRIKNESDKQVLREYALTLHVVKSPALPMPSSAEEAKPQKNSVDTLAAAWVALAKKHDGKDRWYLEALGVGSAGIEERVFPAWLKAVGDDWNTPAGRDIIWRVRSEAALDYLAKILLNKKTQETDAPRYLREFDFLPDSETKNAALLKLVSGAMPASLSKDILARAGRTTLRDKSEVKEAVNTLLAAAKGKADYIELSKEFKLTGNDAEVLDAALSDVKDPRALEGLKLLLKTDSGRQVITDGLSNAKAGTLIALLGGSGDKGAINLLSKVLNDDKRDQKVRGSAVKALALSAAGAEALFELGTSGNFPDDLKTNASTALSMVQYPGISERLAKVFPLASAAGGKALSPISELVKLKGDAEKGKAMFAKAESSCTLCHRIGNIGVDFAPGLSEIGTKLGKDAIYESIINPNAGISMGFETWLVSLKNGQVAMGIIRGETGQEVTVAMPGGVMNNYPKNQILKRDKLPTSMMPMGLQAMFSQEDLVNLVEYLSSLKAPATTAKK